MFSAAMADFRAKPVRRHSQSPRPGEFVGAFGRPGWGTVLGGQPVRELTTEKIYEKPGNIGIKMDKTLEIMG